MNKRKSKLLFGFHMLIYLTMFNRILSEVLWITLSNIGKKHKNYFINCVYTQELRIYICNEINRNEIRMSTPRKQCSILKLPCNLAQVLLLYYQLKVK